MAYLLLDRFEATFTDGPYRHRDSSLGNKIANYLYDDLHATNRSAIFVERVDAHTRVLNRTARIPGIRARRGDGSFGEIVPNAVAVAIPGFVVASGPTATTEIGAEVKILQKAMIQQIDRVATDLRNQGREFENKNRNVIKVALVGVNHAAYCVSYEGERAYRTDGKLRPHPIDEAEDAKRRLHADAESAFDEFVLLEYRATNEPPYAFEWVSRSRTESEYASALVRILRRYEAKFG